MKPRTGYRRRGSAFISTIILSGILFIASAVFLLMTSAEYALNRRSVRHTTALNLAEAGVDYAVWALPENADDATAAMRAWDGGGTEADPYRHTRTSFAAAGAGVIGDFAVQAHEMTGTGYENNWIIVSTGYVPGIGADGVVPRAVRVRAAPRKSRLFSEVFFGDNFVKLHGGVMTDSYDSRNGPYGGANVGSNGDVATNGSILELSGGPVINGDAATGPDGTITGNGTVTGEISHDMERDLPPVTVPPALVGLDYYSNPETPAVSDGLLSMASSQTRTLPPGDYKLRQIKLSASSVLTIEGPAQVYITGYKGKAIETSANTLIVCNGRVDFYIDARVALAGQGITNATGIPSDLRFWITGGTEANPVVLDYSGGSDFYGVVYGPSANVNLSGSGSTFGSFVGLNVDCGGGSGYHYDDALGELEIPVPGHSVVYWQEKRV
ncbi:MAG: hypothetical protein PHN82_06825 [bacterium]|nr:hypothetical protein [bacterium]